MPFLIYLCVSVYYFSSYLDKDLGVDERFAATWEFFLRVILFIMIVYFTYFEVR